MSDLEVKTPTEDQDSDNLPKDVSFSTENTPDQEEEKMSQELAKIESEDIVEMETESESGKKMPQTLENIDENLEFTAEGNSVFAANGGVMSETNSQQEQNFLPGTNRKTETRIETITETAEQESPDITKTVPHKTRPMRRDATFITPPRDAPTRLTAQAIDNQNAAISALISQQHDDLMEQNLRTKEIIAAVRRNIRNTIQTKRQEQLVRQNKILPVARQNMKLASVNLNEFTCDLPKQRPRILLPSKRRAKRWRIKLPPLDKYHGNQNKYHGSIKKSSSTDFR